jgi:GPH family glycoside/pentoside/hexuronide:cation symporter
MNREALFSGLWIAVEKAGFAIGAMAVGGLLQWGGLQATPATAALALQPESVVLAIRIAIALVPGVLFVASLFFIQRCAFEEASGKLAS